MKMNLFFVLAVLGLVLVLSGCTQQAATTPADTTGDTHVPTDAAMQDDAMTSEPHDDTAMDSPAMTDDAHDSAMDDDAMMDDSPDDAMMDESNTIAHFAGMSPSGGYKAVYSSVSSGPTGDIASTMTMYVKSPNFRTDSMVESSGFTIETRSFYELNGTEFVSCSNFQGSWNCQTTQVNASNQVAGSEATNSDLTFEADGTKTAAGETGTCFKGNSISHPEQHFRLCYTDDGILVYYFVDSGQGATSEMTATSVTRGIESSVFTKPA